MRTRKLAVSALALLTAATLLGGCGSTREDLTPELMTLSQRRVDVSNTIDLTWDTNARAMWHDLSLLALTDRPSRLTNAPVPH